MARHRYRVTRQLLWMDGGRPGPDFTWNGGTPTVYEPGVTITLDAQEVSGVSHCLEALDDVGGAVLDRAHSRATAPAQVTSLEDFHPKDRAWLVRATDERLRRQGRTRELVERIVARGTAPTVKDLDAVRRGPSLPESLLADLAKILSSPRRRGPKTSRRSTSRDLAIKAWFQYQLRLARLAHEGDNRAPRDVSDVAKQRTAKVFGISKRTVERVIALRPRRPRRA